MRATRTLMRKHMLMREHILMRERERARAARERERAIEWKGAGQGIKGERERKGGRKGERKREGGRRDFSPPSLFHLCSRSLLSL